MKKNRDVQGLIRLLDHQDTDVSERVIEILGSFGQDALPLLISALNSDNAKIRLGAIGAIGIIHDPVSVLPLMDIVRKDPCLEVRLEALLALGVIGDPLAVPVCRESLRDRCRYIRYGSSVALGRLRWEPKDDEAWAYYFIGLQDWDGLRSLGKSASGPMLDILKDDDPQVRMHLIDLLSRTGSPRARDACTRLLKDPRDSVRYMTVLSSIKSGLAAKHLPLLLSQRERTGPDPAVAAVLNFLFLGIGYNYMGRWWGFLVFMSYMSIIVLAQLRLGPFLPYLLAYPITALFAIQTYREVKRMADVSL
jgi:HEAT repeat protein